MTITVRKAGEVVAKTVAKAAHPAAPHLVTLKTPRAVTAAEAPFIAPAPSNSPHLTNPTSLMPWKGWLERWLEKKMGAERYKKYIRNVFFFMPDDIYDLQQSPKPNQKVPISATDPTLTHMYRYPSPGSQMAPVNVPTLEDGEDPYDTGYFKRDTRRRYLSESLGNPELEKIKLSLMDPNDPAVQEEMKKLEAGPESSPGNKGRFATGPTNFDPTGLRATMSVTWSALEKSLDAHMPDHLPTPVWVGREAEIIKWYEDRNLPVPMGEYYAPLKVSRDRRVAKW